MTRDQKAKVIDYLTSEFLGANTIIVCDYKGLSVKDLKELRIAAKKADAKVQVVKNTLAGIALKGADKEGLELKDTNILVWGNDPISVSKVVAKFAEAKEKFSIKSGYLDGKVADAAKIDAFSKLPSREELLGMLLSVWMAPLRNFAIGLDALRAKKEEIAA